MHIYIYIYVYTFYGNTICQNLHLDTGNRWKQIIPVYYLKGRGIFQAIESSQDLSRALVTRIAAAKVEIRLVTYSYLIQPKILEESIHVIYGDISDIYDVWFVWPNCINVMLMIDLQIKW